MASPELGSRRALGIFAHPDDCEILAAGTLIHLYRKGYEIAIATVSTGDMGSAEISSPEISRVRFGEAARSAGIIKGRYYCLGASDVKFSVSISLR